MVSAGSNIIHFGDYEDMGEGEVRSSKILNPRVENHLGVNRKSLHRALSKKEFFIPEYQRGFQWNEEQIDNFVEDLEKFIEETNKPKSRVSDVFFGSIFLSQEPESNSYDIIDGQQRLTTVFLTLRNIQIKLSDLDPGFDVDPEITDLKPLIYKNIGVGKSEKPRLELNENNSEFFEALMLGEEEQTEFIFDQDSVHQNTKYDAISYEEFFKRLNLDTEELNASGRDLKEKVEFKETNENLLAAYRKISDRLAEILDSQDYDTEERAKALINTKRYLLNAFRVAEITVDDDSKLLMRIFRVLNDRGMDLKKKDLMKTRVFSRFEGEDKEAEGKRKWRGITSELDDNNRNIVNFVNDYLTIQEKGSKNRSDISEEMLNAFETSSISSSESLNVKPRLNDVQPAIEFLENLESRAEYFHDIIEPYERGMQNLDDEDVRGECNRTLRRLHGLGTKQWRPLITSTYYQVCEGEYPEKSLRNIMQDIERIQMRLVFTDVNPRVMEDVYAEAGEIFRKQELDTDTELGVTILGELTEKTSEVTGEDFIRNLSSLQPIGNKTAKQILRRTACSSIESENELIKKELNSRDDVVTVEHILPKKPAGGDDEYTWIKDFYMGGELSDKAPRELRDKDFIPGQYEELLSILKEYVNKAEADSDSETVEEKIRDINSKFDEDIANRVLLEKTDNSVADTAEFDEKKSVYLATDYFEELEQNEYMSEAESWTISEFTERKVNLTEKLVASLKFDIDRLTEGLKRKHLDEHKPKIEEQIKEENGEIATRIRVLAANYSEVS